MAEQNIKVTLTAKDDTSRAFNSAEKNLKKFESQSRKATKQTRSMRGSMGQLGYQVQDVAVQLQMGQNAMMIFGQQGSQIASIFGPSGAVIGALLAVTAALGTALMPSLFNAKDSFKEFKKVADQAKNSVITMTDGIYGLSDSFKEMAAHSREAAQLEVALMFARSQQAADLLRESLTGTTGLTGAFQDVEADTARLIAALTSVPTAGKRFAALKGTIDKLGLSIGQVTEASRLFKLATSEDATAKQINESVNAIAALAVSTGDTAFIEFAAKLAKQSRELTLLSNQASVASGAINSLSQSVTGLGKVDHGFTDVQRRATIAIRQRIAETLKQRKLEVETQKQYQAIFIKNEKEAQKRRLEVIKEANGEVDGGFIVSLANQKAASEAHYKALKAANRDIASDIMNAYETASMSVENTLADAMMGTKSWGEAMKSIFREVAREYVITNMVKPLMGNIGDAFKTAFTGKAIGGPVAGGNTPYIVGEKGPELFVPNSAGQIVPNDQLGSGGAVNVTFNIQANDTRGFDQLLQQRRGQIIGMVNQAMNDRGQRAIA